MNSDDDLVLETETFKDDCTQNSFPEAEVEALKQGLLKGSLPSEQIRFVKSGRLRVKCPCLYSVPWLYGVQELKLFHVLYAAVEPDVMPIVLLRLTPATGHGPLDMLKEPEHFQHFVELVRELGEELLRQLGLV